MVCSVGAPLASYRTLALGAVKIIEDDHGKGQGESSLPLKPS
jgi:hypothetical protein